MERPASRRLSAALWRARMEELGRALRRFWFPLLLVLCMAALFLFSVSSAPQHVSYVRGEVIGAHQAQTDTGRGATYADVRLDDGGVIRVELPRGALIPINRRVVIEVLSHDRPPRGVIYRFDRLEAAPDAAE